MPAVFFLDHDYDRTKERKMKNIDDKVSGILIEMLVKAFRDEKLSVQTNVRCTAFGKGENQFHIDLESKAEGATVVDGEWTITLEKHRLDKSI